MCEIIMHFFLQWKWGLYHAGLCVSAKLAIQIIFEQSGQSSLYCHVYEWLQTRFRLVIGATDQLQIVTTSNCNFIANLHAWRITRTHIKSSQSAFTDCSLVTDPNNVLCSRPYCPANVSQLTHCSNCSTLSQSQSQNYFTTGGLTPINSS
jgi:hypothetical protein